MEVEGGGARTIAERGKGKRKGVCGLYVLFASCDLDDLSTSFSRAHVEVDFIFGKLKHANGRRFCFASGLFLGPFPVFCFYFHHNSMLVRTSSSSY